MANSPITMHEKVRAFPVENRWCVHAYYSLCPYAPDGSGRILLSGVDLNTSLAEVIILSPEGKILNRFGSVPVTPSFWHTGLWQSWSPDGKAVIYQSGSLKSPKTTRYHLDTDESIEIEGDMEGFPPQGEPALSCSHGMLYAAGYGGNHYNPDASPIPFQARNQHGISRITFDSPSKELILSTEAIFERHPLRDRILKADREIKKRLGQDEGLTLMTYCVRWNRSGSRCLFYFGNHCVDSSRGEPKIASIFTADRHLKEIHMALDLSFDKRGVHWSWQADNESLIGYGPREDDPGRVCLAEVRYDGSGYRKICDHESWGHPSNSPADNNLIVTDEGNSTGGNVVFISKKTGETIQSINLPKFIGDREPPGRNQYRICHHPVFNLKGDRVLFNTLGGKHATLAEIEAPQIGSVG